MHKLLVVAALAGALSFGAPAHAQQTAPAAQQEALGVNINAFVALKPGMSTADVVRIIGRPGQETSRMEAMGTATVSYRWSDDGMRSIIATLQNDKLISASQLALQTNVRGEPATLAKFNQLRPGMTFAEVTQVMGPAGIPVSFTSLMGTVTFTISWAGATPGSTAVVTFQGDRLFSTLQAGLQ
ncbi:MAG TPA: DUF3862 domain-containing protein [Longimicrobium sp.]|jgi:outer membrane protein assembly factor BamE (lipoprotein component of BamABCDE complex)|uniref:DUF3862 domain-containing protein n=1 Tax=Longimicrobium sp. TaxID=2029185 RepID=UPI002EDAF47D